MPAGELEFATPVTVDHAVLALAGEGEAIAMGGGTSVAILLKNNLISPDRIVWLGRVPALRLLAIGSDGGLAIGATVTLRELAAAEPVRRHAPALAYAAGRVGNSRVRAVATLGGALAHGDPRQDIPPVLLALEARLRIAGPAGEREVPVAGFHTGFLETALADGELVTQIIVPAALGRRSVYQRFTPGSEDDYPTVGVAATAIRGNDGRLTRAALALAGVGPTPLLVPEAGELAGIEPGADDLEAVAAAAERTADPVDDRLGSVRYKKAMTREWTRRALHACLTGHDGGR